ncbi:Aste57867_12373 [Aphanomyces stellatus]|uniref:Aste57867_12373 protein n=1 Tax=Aphanomyces stellatus TaxID=120398 RepID=A0A485KXE1_9STRA|nr:hypothetical protein As57867_012327 [Aphanomyces stellatus]VFT89225.1 Aste57867_12373 [Aphanomyces stellatus]
MEQPAPANMAAEPTAKDKSSTLFPALQRENSKSKQAAVRGSGRRLLGTKKEDKSQRSLPTQSRFVLSSWSRAHDSSTNDPDASGRSLQGLAAFPRASWQVGDYVRAKCHNSNELFAGHIQFVHDDVFTILFDDLTVDRNVPSANIHSMIDADATALGITFVPMEDHKDDESEASVLPESRVSVNDLDNEIMERIKKALPSLANLQPTTDTTTTSSSSLVVQRLATVLYDDLTTDETHATPVVPSITLTQVAVFANFAAQNEDTRTKTHQQLQRMQATMVQMIKAAMPAVRKTSGRLGFLSGNAAQQTVGAPQLPPPTHPMEAPATLAAGHNVLVHQPRGCFFGMIQVVDVSGSTLTVVEVATNKTHVGIPVASLQWVAPIDELRHQFQELSKQHDVLYPGSKVLNHQQDLLVPATVRRRRTATCFDIKIDNSLIALTQIHLDQLIAVPRQPKSRVRLSKQSSIESGGLHYHVHERVIVHDLEDGSSNHGYVLGMNSNKTVVVEFDNGQVDSSVPHVFLRKADSSSRDASAYLEALNIDQAFGVGDCEYNVDDWVMANHPLSNLLERGRIAQLHGNDHCDVQFSDSVISKHVSLRKIQQTTVPKVVKPSIFALHDYVMAFNPRFKRYCTGQVTAVVGHTYRVVFDCGETYDAIPHDFVTTITDTSVLSPKKRITSVWKSCNGIDEEDSNLCHGNPTMHKMVCQPQAAKRLTFEAGEAVMAQFAGSAKYFMAVVLQSVPQANAVDVSFASSESGLGIASERVFSIDKRHQAPILFHVTSQVRTSNTTNTQPPKPSPPRQQGGGHGPRELKKQPSMLTRMRTMLSRLPHPNYCQLRNIDGALIGIAGMFGQWHTF